MCGGEKILYYTYSATPDPDSRGKGYNTRLRKHTLVWARSQGVEAIVSVPFPGAKSEGILRRLGFLQEGRVWKLSLR